MNHKPHFISLHCFGKGAEISETDKKKNLSLPALYGAFFLMFVISLNWPDSSLSQLWYDFKLHTSDSLDAVLCFLLRSCFSLSSWPLLFCFFSSPFLSHCLEASLDQEWSISSWLKCYQIKTEFRYENPHLIRLHGLWAIILPSAGDKGFADFYFCFIETLLFKHTNK